MKELLEYLASYPTWVKIAIILLSSVIVSLLVFFRPTPAASTKPGFLSEPSVEIEGPSTAPLGKTTYYTIISQNAVRGMWSVGGFQNEPILVEPLGPSHQISIQPTDETRVGENFTIVFIVYDSNGKSATARKQFIIAAN